jgi:hypothetical protein
MRTRGLLVLSSFLLMCAVVAPAAAGLAPYVRIDYGGSQFRMTDANNLIRENEAAFREWGYPIEFKEIGVAYGPGASVGLWLTRGLRLGATYSYLRAVRNNGFEVPENYSYVHEVDLRMTEIGVEAAVRFKRLGGLTVGANVAQGRGELIEGVTEEAYGFGYAHLNAKAHKTKTTYGAFVGLDQTNSSGVAGFIRAGFQYRDIGRMSSEVSSTDGIDTVHGTGRTIWLDYSGFYVKVGVGYDLVR